MLPIPYAPSMLNLVRIDMWAKHGFGTPRVFWDFAAANSYLSEYAEVSTLPCERIFYRVTWDAGYQFSGMFVLPLVETLQDEMRGVIYDRLFLAFPSSLSDVPHGWLTEYFMRDSTYDDFYHTLLTNADGFDARAYHAARRRLEMHLSHLYSKFPAIRRIERLARKRVRACAALPPGAVRTNVLLFIRRRVLSALATYKHGDQTGLQNETTRLATSMTSL